MKMNESPDPNICPDLSSTESAQAHACRCTVPHGSSFKIFKLLQKVKADEGSMLQVLLGKLAK
jgi:hypothetical protein